MPIKKVHRRQTFLIFQTLSRARRVIVVETTRKLYGIAPILHKYERALLEKRPRTLPSGKLISAAAVRFCVFSLIIGFPIIPRDPRCIGIYYR